MAKDKSKKKEGKAPASIQNRKARYDYLISDTVEAGLVLVGSEVKSLYSGLGNLTDAYCRVVNSEMWLYNLDIEPYEKTSAFQHERRRDRKCLLHRKEIDTLERKALEKGFTLIPLSIYFKNGRAKVLIGLGRGKANYDKRAAIAEKDTRKEVEQARALRF